MVTFNLSLNGNRVYTAREMDSAPVEDSTIPPDKPQVEEDSSKPKTMVKGKLVVRASRTLTGMKIELDWEGPFNKKDKDDPWITDREVSKQDSRIADQVRHKLSQVVTEALDSIQVGGSSLRDLVRKYTMRGLLQADDYRLRQVTYQLRKELEKTLASLPVQEVSAFKELYGSNFSNILSDGTLSYRASKAPKVWKKKSEIEVQIPIVSETVDARDVNLMDPIEGSTKEDEMKQSLKNAFPENPKVGDYIQTMESEHGIGFWNGFSSIDDLKEDFKLFAA